MNKFFTIVGACVLAAIAAPISVLVNGQPVRFPVGQPMEVRGKVLVPLRGVFEELGAKVIWDQAAQEVTIGKGEKTIKLTIGQDHALVNEQTIVMQGKAIVRNRTAYVPLRFLAETLDANVRWDGESQTVHISTQATIAAPSTQRKPPPPVR